MSESQEQQFNPEQQTSSEQQATPEFQAKVEQGQNLAEQIQSMRERAQTKEDYRALQEKLVELRKIFSAETEELDESYKDFMEVVSQVFFAIETTPNLELPSGASEWEWRISTGTEGNMIVDLGYIFEDDELVDRSKFKFDKLTSEVTETLTRDKKIDIESRGFKRLKERIKNKKVKSYITREGQWAMELEPDPRGYRDFQEVCDDVIANLQAEPGRFNVKMFQIVGELQTYMDMGIQIDPSEDTQKMHFNDIPPSALVGLGTKSLKTLGDYAGERPDDLSNIKAELVHRKVKSYSVNGHWFLEVEPGPPIFPLTESIADIGKFFSLNDLFFDPRSVEWTTDSNHKYVGMDLDISSLDLSDESYFKTASSSQRTAIRHSANMVSGIGINSLKEKLGGDVLVRNVNYNGKWFLETMEQK